MPDVSEPCPDLATCPQTAFFGGAHTHVHEDDIGPTDDATGREVEIPPTPPPPT